MYYPRLDANAPHPKSDPLTQKNLISAAYQIARGMEHLEQKKVNSLLVLSPPMHFIHSIVAVHSSRSSRPKCARH